MSADAIAASPSCRQTCTADKKLASSDCTESYLSCKDTCREDKELCMHDVTEIKDTCIEDCSGNSSCTRSCNTEFRAAKKICSLTECNKHCTREKNDCRTLTDATYRPCSKYCIEEQNISCGNYSPGERFVQGCSVCACTYEGNISCVETELCGFSSTAVPKAVCAEQGLYQQLCNGPYFDIVCTAANYCICEGDADYSCPAAYTCLDDFNIKAPRTEPIPGWKTLLGEPLGDIGICVKELNLSGCGNGVCDYMICDNCTPVENEFTCPADCA